ncbi:MAG: hypothetical protein K5764_02540 [Prevotella sp.]|nr:hypothetical protein [Prevotella sp.]
MKRAFLTIGLALSLLTVAAQENSYIVKTRSAKKAAVVADNAGAVQEEEETATDFISQHFKFYSLCDWKEGMKFMVLPEKYDLIVKTFADASTEKEVSSMSLRYKIMVYKGHKQAMDGHDRLYFLCQDNNKEYYYEIPNGSFEDYCYGKLGVPTLAYLGDVDIAREQLMGKKMFTKATVYRIDTEFDGDGFREVIVPKNEEVTVTAVGVGSRSFPVKIIVEDKDGNEFYQNVAMSKTNSGMRDDEFIMDSVKHTFYGAFELQDAIMTVNKNFASYLGQTIHNKYRTEMITRGDGKERHVTVPKMLSFRVDQAQMQGSTEFVTLTLTELDSRRVYYKQVTFKNPDTDNTSQAKIDEYFGYLFAMGEGQKRETTQAARAAIQQGRVIKGMTEDEVILAMGQEPDKTVTKETGLYDWIYIRSQKLFVIHFGRDGMVQNYTTASNGNSKSGSKSKKGKKVVKKKSAAPKADDWKNGNGTPL